MTSIGSVERFVRRSVESGFAFVTINAFRVVATVATHTATFVVSVDVQRQALLVHIRIVLAFLRVAKTVAS